MSEEPPSRCIKVIIIIILQVSENVICEPTNKEHVLKYVGMFVQTNLDTAKLLNFDLSLESIKNNHYTKTFYTLCIKPFTLL